MRANCRLFAGLVVGTAICLSTPDIALAQGNSQKGDAPAVSASASISLTKDMQVEIRNWYSDHPHGGVEALPPGIRKRLARGKPLPPGIAKQVAPEGLRSRIRLPDGYGMLEVGVDVLLVEAATGIVHDILMDAVR